MMTRVKYTGLGGELFPELNWLPKPGEVREIDLSGGSLEDHPTLEETDEPLTLITETEYASGQGDDDDNDDNKEEEVHDANELKI